jgi:hypothetical protein
MSTDTAPAIGSAESAYGEDGELRVTLERKEVKRQDRADITGDLAFLARLDEFVAAVQKMINDHFAQQGYSMTPPTITVMNGMKNVRIVRSEPHTRSVYCFVDKATGDIFKAAGWKAPAKHARGNIYNQDMLKGCGVYGAEYLR